jgi:hypothetical protein
MATGYGAGRPRGQSLSPVRDKNFHFSSSSRLAVEPTQPFIQLVPETLSPGVMRHGREAEYTPQTTAEVKKTWIYTSTSSIRLHGVVLNTHLQLLCRGQENMDLHIHTLHTPSWCSAEYTPPTTAEVKKTWIYTSTPSIRLHGVVLNWMSAGTTSRPTVSEISGMWRSSHFL